MSTEAVTNILHAIWKNETLEDHQLSESLALFYSRIPTWRSGLEQISSYSIDEILRRATMHPTVDWVAIHGEGNIYRSQNRILDCIEEFIATLEPNIFVAGHLIDKPGFYCGLHEQFVIVNVRAYLELGCPYFGDYGNREAVLRDYTAGPSLHDNYTPTYLKAKESHSKYKTWTCGWNIINVALEHGYEVVNLPVSLRDEKMYLYPRDNTNTFLKNMDLLYNMEAMENITQNRALIYLLLKKFGFNDHSWPNAMGSFQPRKVSVFVYNTESLVPSPQWIKECGGPLAGFIGTCAGFLDLANLKHFGFDEKTTLVYYDLNPDSIFFKNYMFENFDGDLERLPVFIKDFKNKHPEVLIADNNAHFGLVELRKEFPNHDEFRSIWNRMRALERKFVHFNLFEDYKSIVAAGPKGDERVLMCISDIFTGTNELIYGIQNLRSIFKSMLSEFKNRSKLIIQGTDYKNAPVLDYVPELLRKYGDGGR